MNPIRVAIVGVGNCASSLLQGIHYYRDKSADDAERPGVQPGGAVRGALLGRQRIAQLVDHLGESSVC